MYDIKILQNLALECRKRLTTMTFRAKTGHIGGSLSSVDIIVALYHGVMKINPKNPDWENRDRFVLSKGHSVEGYYAALASRGYFPIEELDTYCQFNSRFTGHPNIKIPGVDMCTGALGHGLPVATGMALAGKMNGQDYKVYTLMGDGEQDEGSNWEAAMAAAKFGLDNMVGIIDRNRLQISGITEDIMPIENLLEKYRSFGWKVSEVDGHNMAQLVETFENLPFEKGSPNLIIANTTKGKGISFMENQVKWHHGVLDGEQYAKAMEELGATLEEVSEECAN